MLHPSYPACGHVHDLMGVLAVSVAADGVYLLQEHLATAVSAWVGVSVFGAPGGAIRALSGCIRKARLLMDDLPAEDRIHLLEYWEVCSCSAAR